MKRVKLIEDEPADNKKISFEHSALMNKYFLGCERISAIPAKYYSGVGDRIEIYDLKSKDYVGAIYPDGASMIWPMCWYKDRKNSFNPVKYKTTYSDIFNHKKIHASKRVRLIDDTFIAKRKIKSKRRVQLNEEYN